MRMAILTLALFPFLFAPARAGDFNGDGREDIAVFRPESGLWAIRGVTRLYFGTRGDIPVAGDYNGNGTDSPAIFRPYRGLWAVHGSGRVYFGGIDDEPRPADYNGDGACDIAICRPENGMWAVRGITRAYWGRKGDLATAGGGAPRTRLPVTGQTTSRLPEDDGDYQAGYAFNYLTTWMEGDLVTIDFNTGLMWAADGDAKGCDYGTTSNWSSAISFCESLRFAGYSDWRLPNVKELQSIVDYETQIGTAAIDKIAFPNTKLYPYWSSTSPNLAVWAVSFANGGVLSLVADQENFVRPVRGGR